MEPGDLTTLERHVLTSLLRHDHPAFDALRQQALTCRVTSREMTGVGFYTTFEADPDARVPGLADLQLGDVVAEIEGLERGAGFVLWIEDGRLDTLEAFTYDEPWPESVSSFSVAPAEHPAGATPTDLEQVSRRWGESTSALG